MPPVPASYLDSARTFNVKSYFTSVHLGEQASEFDHAVRKDQLDQHVATLQAAIDAEVSRSVAKDDELEAKINTDVAAAVASIVDAAPGALDTLNEIATALGDDSNIAANLTAQINDISAAQAADKAELEGKIADEKARAEAAESTLSDAVAAEVTARQTDVATLRSEFTEADSALQSALDAEIARSLAKDADLDAALAAEVSDREAGDSSIRSDMEVADTQLQSNIDSERTRAETAEADLAKALVDETSAREADVAAVRDEFADADSALDNKLDTEIARASAAEADLQGQITVEANTRAAADAAHETRMTEEENARRSSDESLDTKISVERDRALAAESDLDSKIDDEVTARVNEITRVEGVVEANKLEASQALADEAAARLAKDLAIDAALDQERRDRELAVSDLQNDKLDRVGGTGEGLHSFEEVKIRGSLVDGNDVYLTFGRWRIKGASDGSHLIFQYENDEGTWQNAVPFITC